jgi:hypothetical protein
MTSSSVDVYQQQKYQQKQFDILKSLPVQLQIPEPHMKQVKHYFARSSYLMYDKYM